MLDPTGSAEDWGGCRGASRSGIPIGNLTSQFFANVYLDDLDHALKEDLGLEAYLRYVDDLVLLGDDKGRLQDIKGDVAERLGGLKLRMHPHKAHISAVSAGLDLLGYTVFPDRRRLRSDNGHRFARRLRRFARAYASHRMAWEDFDSSVQAWIGHARHADTIGLRRAIFEATVFRRGDRAEGGLAGAPGRLVEQPADEAAFRQPQQEPP